MTAEEALHELGIELPYTRKISCPRHSDSDPSLHVYPEDKGFYCFSCGEGGDGWTLLSFFTGRPVGELMRERGHVSGPRPRSRWEQVADIQNQAVARTADFTVEARALAGLEFVASRAERVDYMYEDLFSKHVPEDTPPFHLQQQLDDLTLYYEGELGRARLLDSMRHGQLQAVAPEAEGSGPVPTVRLSTPGPGDHVLPALLGDRGSQENDPAWPATYPTNGARDEGHVR